MKATTSGISCRWRNGKHGSSMRTTPSFRGAATLGKCLPARAEQSALSPRPRRIVQTGVGGSFDTSLAVTERVQFLKIAKIVTASPTSWSCTSRLSRLASAPPNALPARADGLGGCREEPAGLGRPKLALDQDRETALIAPALGPGAKSSTVCERQCVSIWQFYRNALAFVPE